MSLRSANMDLEKTATLISFNKFKVQTMTKNIVTGVLFDLNRAFDTSSIEIISEKLSNIGIRGDWNKLIISFLSNRYFKVKQGNILSDDYSDTTGTPQGSILGSLICLRIVNNLPNYKSLGKIYPYADDTSRVNINKTVATEFVHSPQSLHDFNFLATIIDSVLTYRIHNLETEPTLLPYKVTQSELDTSQSRSL